MSTSEDRVAAVGAARDRVYAILGGSTASADEVLDALDRLWLAGSRSGRASKALDSRQAIAATLTLILDDLAGGGPVLVRAETARIALTRLRDRLEQDPPAEPDEPAPPVAIDRIATLFAVMIETGRYSVYEEAVNRGLPPSEALGAPLAEHIAHWLRNG